MTKTTLKKFLALKQIKKDTQYIFEAVNTSTNVKETIRIRSEFNRSGRFVDFIILVNNIPLSTTNSTTEGVHKWLKRRYK